MFVDGKENRPLDIEDLSADILVLVFSILHGQDIARCARVCRSFADLILSDLRLQYRIELAKNGMVDGHRSNLPVSEKLQRLREYSAKFVSGTFDHADLGEHPNYLLHLRNRRWNTTVHHESASASLHGQNGRSDLCLCVITPGSAQAGIESSLSLLPIGTARSQGHVITKLAIDGTQDLLVMAERVYMAFPQHLHLQLRQDKGYIRFFSLSGSKVTRPTPHPAAKLPSVRVSVPGPVISLMHNNAPPMLTVIEVHISGRYVISELVEVRGGNIEAVSVSVCDWRTGEAILIDVGPQIVHVVPLGSDDPYFLVVPKGSTADFHLTVYKFSHSGGHGGPICTLQLPLLNPGERLAWHEIQSGDRPLYNTTKGHFHSDLSLSLVALTFGVTDPNVEYECQTHLLIPRMTILAHARAAEYGSGDGSAREPKRVPWEDWGPRGCLRLRQRPPAGLAAWRVQLIPFGARMPLVVFGGPGLDTNNVWVYVFDLNPFLPRPLSGAAGTTGTIGMVEDIEAVLPGVLDPACSSIPFRAYRFNIRLPAMPLEWQSRNVVRSVVMGMTGFTMKLYGVEYERAVQTWTV